MPSTTYTTDRKCRCNTCGGVIDPGKRMTTTIENSMVTNTHETCTPTPLPAEIFGIVQQALKAAKRLA